MRVVAVCPLCGHSSRSMTEENTTARRARIARHLELAESSQHRLEADREPPRALCTRCGHCTNRSHCDRCGESMDEAICLWTRAGASASVASVAPPPPSTPPPSTMALPAAQAELVTPACIHSLPLCHPARHLVERTPSPCYACRTRRSSCCTRPTSCYGQEALRKVRSRRHHAALMPAPSDQRRTRSR